MTDTALPYRSVMSEGVVELGPWSDRTSGQPLLDFLPGWDYQSRLAFWRRAVVDVGAVRDEAGLPEDAGLAVAVRFWSTNTHLRTAGCCVPLDEGTGRQELDLHVDVAGEGLGRELVLETSIVLSRPLPFAPAFVPKRKGSVLWRDLHALRLEGTAGIMPTTPIRFSDYGLPASAAWLLDVDATRWHAPLLGNLQVMLNVDNPLVREGLEGPGLTERERALLWSALRVDLVADLLALAFADADFTCAQTHDEPEELLSLRGFVVGVLQRYLSRVGEDPQTTYDRLKGERQLQPSRFRALVQSGLGFPPALT